MFDPTDKPRVYAMPPGADFASELAAGIVDRTKHLAPEALARVTILVNTRRMQRRLKDLLSDQARLLPSIKLVTELDSFLPTSDLPPPMSSLRRKLELAALVSKLIDASPDLAPRAASLDLADSLASLLDEMEGEGVDPSVILGLDTGDLSGHWERSLKFLSIVGDFTKEAGQDWIGVEARRRSAAFALSDMWAHSALDNPVILAGSTGSRDTTALLMQAIAHLPQGAIVLPGFDYDLPDAVFSALIGPKLSPLGAEDHPQFRFAKLIDRLGLTKADIRRWTERDDRAARNKLISLSLRPAPVTDQWRSEGPKLGDLTVLTDGLALVEAPEPKQEALAIAIALREAVEDGKTAALITPDRTLGRRVAAALQRWDIIADDSAGRPLSLTAPGRLLRQVAQIMGKATDPIDVIALLKHPLAFSGAADRGPHLLFTRELELFLRRGNHAELTEGVLSSFAKKQGEGCQAWCTFLADWLQSAALVPPPTLAETMRCNIKLAEDLAAGLESGSGALWDQAAGRDTLAVIETFRAEFDFPGTMSLPDYVRLLESALSGQSTRNQESSRTDVMIWGTLEARVQGADLVVLGGLNEGTWPEQPAADPWLNRKLRREAGLLLPERQIGLSAHDYQQAIAAKTVIITRAKRDAESETIPSRWVSRLTNLLEGLEEQGGKAALKTIRARGQRLLQLSEALTTPDCSVDPEPRPSPAPPRKKRPEKLSVTEIQRLIRDPYAIYARHVLGLRALNPLKPEADARLRGTVFHKIIERAFSLTADLSDRQASANSLREIALSELGKLPWPGIAAHWFGHIDAIADQLVEDEYARRTTAQPIALERKGRFLVPGTHIEISGKIDRIDRNQDGSLIIYDYKSGSPPQPNVIRYFDRQLPIEAVMAEEGGIEDLPATKVQNVVHIGLGRKLDTSVTELVLGDETDFRTVTIKAELAKLLNSYDSDTKGYTSRRAMEKLRFEGDYDHLARLGEWDETSPARSERLP